MEYLSRASRASHSLTQASVNQIRTPEQPLADSPVNVAEEMRVPVPVHRLPTWVPELPVPL